MLSSFSYFVDTSDESDSEARVVYPPMQLERLVIDPGLSHYVMNMPVDALPSSNQITPYDSFSSIFTVTALFVESAFQVISSYARDGYRYIWSFFGADDQDTTRAANASSSASLNVTRSNSTSQTEASLHKLGQSITLVIPIYFYNESVPRHFTNMTGKQFVNYCDVNFSKSALCVCHDYGMVLNEAYAKFFADSDIGLAGKRLDRINKEFTRFGMFFYNNTSVVNRIVACVEEDGVGENNKRLVKKS